MTFSAPMWGTTSRPLEHDPELSWVQLVIDLGIQMHVWVLAPSDNVAKLKRRTTRAFTLEHKPEGLMISEIRTSGLASNERNGYAVALTQP
jgi:hypothetical protein